MQFRIALPDNPLRTFFKVVWKYRFNTGMWPTIWRLSFRYIRGRLMPAARTRRIAEHTRYLDVENQASLKWCSERAITIEELSDQLSFSFVLTSVEQEFRDVFQQSRERAQACLENFDAAGDLYLRHAGNLDLLYSIAKSIDARRVVETGVAYGWSSLALLLAVKDKDGGYVYSTDLPPINALLSGADDRIGIGIAVPDSLRSRWRLFKMADREGLPRALRKARGGLTWRTTIRTKPRKDAPLVMPSSGNICGKAES